MPDTDAHTGVQRLFPDISVAEFIASHLLPRAPRLYHGPLERLALAGGIREDLRVLLSRHAPFAAVFQGRDEVLRYVYELDSEEATAALESGATILLEQGKLFVQSILQELPRDLGFPSALFGCSAFITPMGGGSPWHSDALDNFVIQITGEKQWWFGPNHRGQHAVENIWPTANGSLAAAPELGSEELQIVTLRPGSVLFLPRNYWHRTEALSEPCVSISLGVRRPTHLALILAMLHEQLSGVPELLEPLGPLPPDHGAGAATVERLALSMTRLGQLLPRIDLTAAVRQSVAAVYLRVRYRVVDGISHTWKTDESGERVLSVRRGDTHVTDLALDDADLAAFVPNVLQRAGAGAFTLQELQEVPAVAAADSEMLMGMLHQLVHLGILHCESADLGREHCNLKEFV